MLNNWNCDIKLPDGTEINLSLEPADGVKVDEEILTKDGFVKNYQGYVVTEGEGDNAHTYVKPCKDIETLNAIIENNPELKTMLDLVQIDITSGSFEGELHQFFNGLQTAMTTGGTLIGSIWGPLGNLAGGVIGAGASSAVENIMDFSIDILGNQVDGQYYKEQVTYLTNAINNFKNCLGEENLKLLEDANKKYNELSDRDRSLLSEQEQNNLKQAHTLISGLKNYESALEYAEDRDSNIWEDPWDYIGDNWEADFEDIWSDGYQLGDVTSSAVTAVVDTVETVVACAVGVGKWVWKGIKKLKFW